VISSVAVSSPNPEFDLLDAWSAGSKSAGQALFAAHFDALYRFFRNKVAGDAGDLVQATLLACMESRDTFRRESSFRTFIFGVAHKVLLRHFHGRRRDGRLDPLIASAADFGVTPTQLLGVKQHQKVLLEGLRRIPLEHQALLELHYWEKLTGPELAAVLEVPEGTIRTRLRRAKHLLIERMRELGELGRVETREDDLERWAHEVRQQLVAAGVRVGDGA
jgi:RNA polymerase sigma factor (sigma-70 family)